MANYNKNQERKRTKEAEKAEAKENKQKLDYYDQTYTPILNKVAE